MTDTITYWPLSWRNGAGILRQMEFVDQAERNIAAHHLAEYTDAYEIVAGEGQAHAVDQAKMLRLKERWRDDAGGVALVGVVLLRAADGVGRGGNGARVPHGPRGGSGA
jgi:hypothetical protein